ncbi:MAG: agmatine deiminase family protein [Gemmataceae bacterium]|nr:agmatine deiminase family protein [Gemmataceae bacterium]
MANEQVPAALGWRMPAEWHPHEATWIAWPHERGDWPGKFPLIPWVYAEIVRHLCTGEKVHILVNDAKSEKRARGILKKNKVDLKQVVFFHIPTDRVWTRDSGPIFLVRPTSDNVVGTLRVPSADNGTRSVPTTLNSVGFTNWQFNAWAKYENWHKDDAVPDRILEHLPLPNWKPMVNGRRVVLEGGSIDVNGDGLLLTTEECLLSPVQARNPDLSREDLEKVFADFLGVQKTLWLGRGIVGDDTHGHVDDLARFVNPRTVVSVVEYDPADPNHEPLQENLRRLKSMTDQEGRPLQIVALPMPAPLVFAGQRLPASYANFYIANEKVLVPTFNDPKDRVALGILADLFPERTVVGIHAVDLVWGLGTLHCMTQQQPKV